MMISEFVLADFPWQSPALENNFAAIRIINWGGRCHGDVTVPLLVMHGYPTAKRVDSRNQI